MDENQPKEKKRRFFRCPKSKCRICPRRKPKGSKEVETQETKPVVVKSRRPRDRAFEQQRLPAWQPILNAGSTYKGFIIVGIALVIIGVPCFVLSEIVNEIIVDYTKCSSASSNQTCIEMIKMDADNSCSCVVPFNTTKDITGSIFVYYSLTHFFQNHRKYVKSRDDDQLLGELDEEPKDDCDPFRKSGDKPIVPCGAIANSMFNDTIKLYSGEQEIELKKGGLIWEFERTRLFSNPKDNKSSDKFDKPTNWKKSVWDLENGIENEELIIWMRTSALPTFRKLYATVSNSSMPQGEYKLVVEYNFAVHSEHFGKSVIFSTTTIMGGKNIALACIFIVAGTLCIVLGVLFFYLHFKYGKRKYQGSF